MLTATALTAAFCALTSGASLAAAEEARAPSEVQAGGARTVLGIAGSRFTINGAPTFLLGISYYGGLGASEESLRRDLDDARRRGFNWLRVWATWGSAERDVSAVATDGAPREPFLGRLRRLVAECDRLGLIVDVTLARDGKVKPGGGRLVDLPAHRRAVETLIGALRGHRNWYLDLANERDVHDDRWVSVEELKLLRDEARRLDPGLLVTASLGGHDLSAGDLKDSLVSAGLDFVCPHRPRDEGSPGRTETATRDALKLMAELGRVAPIHYQEPFRRGYGKWRPRAADFLADLRGAAAGGAAGWCLHNGEERDAPGKEPRRSFDLRTKRLFDQLDREEMEVVERAGEILKSRR